MSLLICTRSRIYLFSDADFDRERAFSRQVVSYVLGLSTRAATDEEEEEEDGQRAKLSATASSSSIVITDLH